MIMRVAYDASDPQIKIAKMISTNPAKTVKKISSQERLKQSVDKTFRSIYSLDIGNSNCLG